MLNRRKVAGILAELSDGVVIVGIGLNVNQSRDELPLDAPTEPGSLRSLTGQLVRAARRSSARCSSVSSSTTTRGGTEASTRSTAEIGARDFLRGRRITVDGEEALGVQIQRDGRLEIATPNGHGATRAIESGEVLFER